MVKREKPLKYANRLALTCYNPTPDLHRPLLLSPEKEELQHSALLQHTATLVQARTCVATKAFITALFSHWIVDKNGAAEASAAHLTEGTEFVNQKPILNLFPLQISIISDQFH